MGIALPILQKRLRSRVVPKPPGPGVPASSTLGRAQGARPFPPWVSVQRVRASGGGWYHGAEAGLEAGLLPQLWWVLDGTDHPWTRRALWFEDSDRDGLKGQYPVLGWQLGSPMTLPGDPDLAPTPPAVGTV